MNDDEARRAAEAVATLHGTIALQSVCLRAAAGLLSLANAVIANAVERNAAPNIDRTLTDTPAEALAHMQTIANADILREGIREFREALAQERDPLVRAGCEAAIASAETAANVGDAMTEAPDATKH